MTFTPKEWKDDPAQTGPPVDGTTPLNAAALVDLEERLAAYAETQPGPAGPDGDAGTPGADGDPGPAGASAYAVWVAAGNTGTIDDYLASLIGPQGDPGTPADPAEITALQERADSLGSGDAWTGRSAGDVLTIPASGPPTWEAPTGGGGGGSGVIVAWAGPGTAYLTGQPVTNSGHTYLARNAHTSGATFAGDLAAHWDLLPLTAADVGADVAGAAAAVLASSAQKAANLSDVANAATARTNLGLGTAATQATGAFDAAGAATGAIAAHVAALDPHGDRAYADGLIAANDALVYKGVVDASTSPNYPAASAGHLYKISVAGKIGGGSGPNVEVGDSILCTVDGTAAGTQAAVGANWSIIQTNIDGAVIGPASSVSGDLALFSGTGGKLIAGSGMTPSNDDVLQRKAGAWTNRTPAQVKTDLVLVKADVGLSNVDNTPDTAKPVSTAQQTALDLKAPVASPALTGSPTAPTQTVADNSTKLATTAYADAAAAAKASALTTTAVKTGNYTAAANESVPVDATAGNVTVTLPPAPTDKTRVVVKVIALGSPYSVTIARGGSDVFTKVGGGGSTSLVLSYVHESVLLQYDSATAVWSVQATDTPLSAIDARAPASGPLGDRFIPLSARQFAVFSGTVLSGANTVHNARVRHQACADAASLRMLFANFVGSGSLSLRAGLEVNGAIIPIWFNGKRDVVIEPDSFVACDPIPARLTKGAFFFVRSSITVTAGVTIKCTNVVLESGDGSEAGVGLADKSTSGTITGGSLAYGPWMVMHKPSGRMPSVCFFGDSIVQGSGQIDGVYFWRQFAEGALSVCQAGQSGDISQTVDSAVAGWAGMRYLLPPGANHVVLEWGTNDLNATGTAAALAANILVWAKRYFAAKVWACTMVPRSTSTDAWATVGNQTVNTNQAQRAIYNQWLRAGAPVDPTTKTYVVVGTSGALLIGQSGHPLSGGAIDLCSGVESSQDSGLWKAPGYTSDGIHPTGTGHTAMGALLTASMFT